MKLENRKTPKIETPSDRKPQNGPRIKRHAALLHDFMVADPKVKAKLRKAYPEINFNQRPRPLSDAEYEFELMKDFPEDFKVKEVPPDPALNLATSDGEDMIDAEESPLIKVGKVRFENTSAKNKRTALADKFAREQEAKRNSKRKTPVTLKDSENDTHGNISDNYEKGDNDTEKVTSASYTANTRNWDNVVTRSGRRFNKTKTKEAIRNREFYNDEYESLTERLGEETESEKNLLKDGTEIFDRYNRDTEKKPKTFKQIQRDILENEIGEKDGFERSQNNLLSQEKYKKSKIWEKHFNSEAKRGTKISAEELFDGDGFNVYRSKDLPNQDTTPRTEDTNQQLLILLKEQLKDAEASGSRTEISTILKEIDSVKNRISNREKTKKAIEMVEQIAKKRIEAEEKPTVIQKIKKIFVKKEQPKAPQEKPAQKRKVKQQEKPAQESEILSKDKAEKLDNLLDDLGI